MQKAEKSSVFLLFCVNKYDWRLQVSVSVPPVPVYVFGRQTTLNESTWKRILLSQVSFFAYPRLRRILA